MNKKDIVGICVGGLGAAILISKIGIWGTFGIMLISVGMILIVTDIITD